MIEGERTNRKNSRSVLGSERSGVSSKNTGQQETKVLLLSTFASAFFSVHHTICLEQSASLDALSFRYWLSELDSSSFSASCSRLSVGVTVPGYPAPENKG